MRNISFAITTPQFLDRSKTQTRRLGWPDLYINEFLCGCEKTQGIKKGESINRLGVIVVKALRWEPLGNISQADVIAEGFPQLTPAEFVEMFIQANPKDKQGNPTTPETPVHVITYDHIEGLL